LLMPPDQNESQTRSILLFSSPVIPGATLTSRYDVLADPPAVRAFRAAGAAFRHGRCPTELGARETLMATRGYPAALGDERGQAGRHRPRR
jgi:hypothetical protein